ncbi:hypothetical protein MHYP_G00241630 [Metynnis hypsauchen]
MEARTTPSVARGRRDESRCGDQEPLKPESLEKVTLRLCRRWSEPGVVGPPFNLRDKPPKKKVARDSSSVS